MPANATGRAAQHWRWLAIGIIVSFLVPFVFADRLEVQRDVYYGLYGLASSWAGPAARVNRSGNWSPVVGA